MVGNATCNSPARAAPKNSQGASKHNVFQAANNKSIVIVAAGALLGYLVLRRGERQGHELASKRSHTSLASEERLRWHEETIEGIDTTEADDDIRGERRLKP